MSEEDELSNTTLDDLINKEVSSRKRGVGKRFNRGRGRGRGRGSFRRRGRGRRNLRPSNRSFRGFGGKRRGRGGRNNFSRRRERDNDEPEWRNDKYEERFHGSVKREKSSNHFDSKYGIPATSSRNRTQETTRRREPENFTTKSGLQVSVGSGSSNPDLGSSVQINGLHSNVQSEDLREILQKYGTVKYAYITYDDNGDSNGVGRACFVKAEYAKAAVKDLQDATIDSVAIKITYLGGGYESGRERRNNFTSRRGRGGRDDRDSDTDMDDDNNDRRRGRDSKNAPDTPFNPLAR